ncbi:hypothetical protein D3C71_1609510 [compost metagenome]
MKSTEVARGSSHGSQSTLAGAAAGGGCRKNSLNGRNRYLACRACTFFTSDGPFRLVRPSMPMKSVSDWSTFVMPLGLPPSQCGPAIR